jgi:hypothetical protein
LSRLRIGRAQIRRWWNGETDSGRRRSGRQGAHRMGRRRSGPRGTDRHAWTGRAVLSRAVRRQCRRFHLLRVEVDVNHYLASAVETNGPRTMTMAMRRSIFGISKVTHDQGRCVKPCSVCAWKTLRRERRTTTKLSRWKPMATAERLLSILTRCRSGDEDTDALPRTGFTALRARALCARVRR